MNRPMSTGKATAQRAIPAAPKRYVFLLVEAFSHLSFSAAIEPLRIAQEQGQGTICEWLVLGQDGAPVACSHGTRTSVDDGLIELTRHDTLFVCGGNNVDANCTPQMLSWLRREIRRGLRFGSLSTGAYILAQAGVLQGRKVALHWDYMNSFSEMFPDLDVVASIYHVEKNYFSCSGCAGSLDLMLRLLEEDHGRELAAQVADRLIYTVSRDERFSQRLSFQARSGARDNKCSRAIDLMQAHLEEPLPLDCIAKQVGVSTRQLERLFKRHMDTPPSRYYLELRLQKARDLLLQTDMRLMDIGLACGFSSHAYFTKCYRKRYGVAPSQDDAKVRV